MLDAAEGTHGRCIVKLMGDGALVALQSVMAAVDRAMAIQKGTAKAEAPRADVARIPSE
ncbi:MAG: hypothetical protein ABI920_05380 [Casimicrobiaceae bacterium]